MTHKSSDELQPEFLLSQITRGEISHVLIKKIKFFKVACCAEKFFHFGYLSPENNPMMVVDVVDPNHETRQQMLGETGSSGHECMLAG